MSQIIPLLSLVWPNRLPWPLQKQAFLISQSHFPSFSLPFSSLSPIFILFSHGELVWWGPLLSRCWVDRFLVYHWGQILFLILFPLQTHFHLNSVFLRSNPILLSFSPPLPPSFIRQWMHLLYFAIPLQFNGRRGEEGKNTFSIASHSPSISQHPVKATNECHLRVK